MYGNYYDYGEPDLSKIRDNVSDIMTDTRDAVSAIQTGGTYDEFGTNMADKFKDAGVGGVAKFLKNVYEPYSPMDTPSYSEFMSGTPQRIQDNIAAKQVSYNAGRNDRMKGFQDLLKEVRAYSYGTADADGYIPATNPGPGAQAPEAPAAPELKAVMPKMPRFKDGNDKKTQSSLDAYQELFGNKFSMSDYNLLVAQGNKLNRIKDNLMAYNAAGGKIGSSVFNQMGYDVVKPQNAQGMGPYISNYKGNLIVPQDRENSLFPGIEPFNFGFGN